MEQLKLAQSLNSASEDKGSELLKEVDINYSLPDTFLGKQKMRRKWAGYTSLHFIVMKQKLHLTNELLERGADLVKRGTTDGRTPLHVALDKEYIIYRISKQSLTLIDTLLSRQVEIKNTVNPKCEDGVSHLHIACIANHVKAVNFFAKAKVPLDQPTNSDLSYLPGYTPLCCAIWCSSLDAADILLRHGADLYAKNGKGVSCLHLLVQQIMDLSNFMKMGERTLCSLFEEEIEKLESIVKLVLKARANDEIFIDDTGLSALHIACTLKDTSLVEEFLKRDVVVNLPVKNESKLWPGWTPLHFAACFDIKIAMLLMQNGANISIKNFKGETALDLCAKRFSPANLQLLLSVENRFKDVVLLDNSTKLSDLLSSMDNYGQFRDFLDQLNDVNTVIPSNSPIWPGYNLLHLSVSLNEKTMFESDLDRSFDKNFYLPEVVDSIPERYNCTEDEESLYMKRIELLLEHGCSVRTRNASGQTPIHLAFSLLSKRAVEKLLDHSDEDLIDPISGISHLHIACAVGHLDAVKMYLNKEANVNSRVSIGFDWHGGSLKNVRANSTPLHVATAFRHENIVEHLLKNGADVYARDLLGFTPIHLSAFTRTFICKIMPRVLFKATSKLQDSVGSAGLSHLHVAAWAEDVEAVSELLLNGAQIDRVIEANVEGCSFLDSWAGKTPLLVAVNDGFSPEVVDALLKAGANVHAKDSNGISTLQRGLREMHSPTYSPLLIDQMIKWDKLDVELYGWTPLHVACSKLDIDWARKLLNEGADANARISDEGHKFHGATALHALFVVGLCKFERQNLSEFVELLIHEGADVTLECNGVTPLHMFYNAIYAWYNKVDDSGCYRHAANILSKGHKSYDVNPVNSDGLSHFHFACIINHVEMATKFLDHGVDVNESVEPLAEKLDYEKEEIGGYTPLHFAMTHGSREVAYLLLDRGADVNAEDARGNKPLHVAIKSKFVDPPLIETMLSLGADVHAINLNNESLLYCLLKSGDLTLRKLELFLNCGCLINTLNNTDEFHQGIFGLAMCRAEPTELQSILETLMRAREVKNAIQNGFNIIQSIVAVDVEHKLTMDEYLNVVELCINNDCDLDHRSINGVTALHAAAHNYNLEAVNVLLQLGADMNVIDDTNACPLNDYVIEDDLYSYSRKVVKDLACHLWKMRLTGLEMTESNLRCLEKVEKKFFLINLLEQSCQDELSKTEVTEICKGLVVKDFLSELGAVAEYPRMCLIQRDIIDKYFKCSANLRREFPEFCGLLAYQYRKALARMKLWQPAKKAVLSIYQVELPDLCLEAVLRYFTNGEIKLIIALAEELR